MKNRQFWSVIPAEPGIHVTPLNMDSRFRGNDGGGFRGNDGGGFRGDDRRNICGTHAVDCILPHARYAGRNISVTTTRPSPTSRSTSTYLDATRSP